jgi:hypothetical protein
LAATGLLPFARRVGGLYVGLRPKRLDRSGGSDGQVYDFLRSHGYAIRRFLGHQRRDDTELQPIASGAALTGRMHMLLCV